MSNDRSPADLASEFAAVARVAKAIGLESLAPQTLLHIGNEHLVVLSGRGDKPSTVRQLDLGAARIARKFFRHDPPDSHEIERAIDFVEDEILGLGQPPEGATPLWSASPMLQPWGAVSGPTASIEDVEQWFQRLALAAHGQVSALSGLPAGREAAATLLVLREFMHHRGHVSVAFVEPRQDLAV